MGVKFTEDQQKAIDTLDRSILVSAAAGSGKTAVLVERIIHIITSGKAEVDEMLVVTFTRAAAMEMKQKLTRAIRQHMRENPESAPLMSRQLSKMFKSYITTFDSFATRVIKEFYYMVDRDQNFKVCDDAQNQLLQMEAMEELFEACFEDDNYVDGGSFREFLDHYSNDRDEENLMKQIREVYAKLRSMPNYFTWAEDQAEMLRLPESGNITDSPVFKMLRDIAMEELREAQRECEDLHKELDTAGIVSMIPKVVEPDLNMIRERIDVLKRGVSPAALVGLSSTGYTFPKLDPRKKDEKEAYSQIKTRCKDLRNAYKERIKNLDYFFSPALEESFREMDETYHYTVYYLNLLKEFERRFEEKKRASNLLDFSDMEHIAVSILENPEAAAKLRKRFRYIFIDEYQDTNKLQEYLISRFARPDNQFKVGDVKQSIYGFRQSDPKIFMETRSEFERDEGDDAMVIDLNKNFRSNEATLRYINDVFEGLMPGYDDKAKLYHGLPGDDAYNLVPEVHIIPIEKGGTTGVVASDTPSSGDDAVDEDNASLTEKETEAVYIANLVRNILGTTFYDGKQGVRRTAEPRDIVILCRSTKRTGDLYYKSMLAQNIPTFVNDENGYFDSVEINLTMALLKVLDNGHQDIPLIAVLRSEIFGFTPEELAKIRIAFKESGRKGSYYKAYAYCLENKEALEDPTLYEKLAAAEANLQAWRYRANKMPLDAFIWYVLNESGYYLYAGAMYGGRQRQANLQILTEKAKGYQERNGVISLNGFIRYIDILKKNDVKMGQATLLGEDADVVRIMTMHKSKGLEFPFVIVAGMGVQGQSSTMSKGLMFDSDIGLGISYVNREEKFWRPTLMQRVINYKQQTEEYQENLRVLYVALTRAREKLILVGTAKEKDGEFTFKSKSGYQMLRDKLNLPSNRYFISSEPESTPGRKRNLFEEFQKNRAKLDPSKADYYESLIADRLDYEYAYTDALKTKTKYSVSELRALKAGEYEPRNIELRKPEGDAEAESGVTGAEIGTGYHRILEMVDFCRIIKMKTNDCEIEFDTIMESGENNLSADKGESDANLQSENVFRIGESVESVEIDTAYVQEVMDHLHDTGTISDNVFRALRPAMIHRFFQSEIGRRAICAARKGKLWKEKPFTLRTRVNDQSVLVQGIIDCFFEEDGRLILLDYKSNRMGDDPKPIIEMYEEQIRLYRNALREATDMDVSEAYLYMLREGKMIPMP